MDKREFRRKKKTGEKFSIAKPYLGVQMRSSLETKWAGWFDLHVDETWEYEPKLFHLDGDLHYRPDFFFPESGVWVEVKGDRQGIDDAKMMGLAKAVAPLGQWVIHAGRWSGTQMWVVSPSPAELSAARAHGRDVGPILGRTEYKHTVHISGGPIPWKMRRERDYEGRAAWIRGKRALGQRNGPPAPVVGYTTRPEPTATHRRPDVEGGSKKVLYDRVMKAWPRSREAPTSREAVIIRAICQGLGAAPKKSNGTR